MADNIRLVNPREIDRNPENPRLIFRAEDLEALEDSIKLQGILVPLTLYEHGDRFVILDGERRWRSAIKLGLTKVPAIIQPEPTRMQNIMMMFAIHNTRRDWDPLPAAYKLRELEAEFRDLNRRTPTEAELAQVASLSRGEVRRLKILLGLPEIYHSELLQELEKPRADQRLTVDQVLEATKGVDSLAKRGIVTDSEQERLRRALVEKFRSGVIVNTVAPRQLARISRAVERGDVSREVAHDAVMRIVAEPRYTIDNAFSGTVQRADFEHSLSQLVARLAGQLDSFSKRRYKPRPDLAAELAELRDLIDLLLQG